MQNKVVVVVVGDFLELQIDQSECVVSEISRVPDHIIIPKEGDPGVCQNSTVEPSFDLLIKNQIPQLVP